MLKTTKILAAVALTFAVGASATDLVILHTNDTHSQIEPADDGRGALLQRKAVIDSVRAARENVLLIDAGDMVQGSLYFKYFGGDVEYPIFNMMDYDIRILGNHEFDNGLEPMAKYYSQIEADALSANYDFTDTPLKGMFKPYTIREVDGHKIGFIGLNVDPASLIAAENYEGMKFSNVLETANALAAKLKHELGCELVVAVTHIGYTSTNDKTNDVDLARGSRDIDIIIGGHSHTLVEPGDNAKYPSLVPNADGRLVRIGQTGKYGKYVGQMVIDLDRLGQSDGRDYDYSLIEVTNRFPESKLDHRIEAFLAPYKQAVDSVNHHVVAIAAEDMPSPEHPYNQANWTADFGLWYGNLVADSLQMSRPDMAIMNVGGIRQPFMEGPVTEGLLLSAFPFSNRYVIIKLKGKDLVDAMQVAAKRGGEAISGNARVVYDADGKVKHMIINGKEVEPEREYVVGTIDYLAGGNDDLVTLANNELLWSDEKILCAPIIRYVSELSAFGLPMVADPNPRFVEEVIIP